jgi:hypothetical protein
LNEKYDRRLIFIKEELAQSINNFFKKYDSYNYKDNIKNNLDEKETIEEISNSLTDIIKTEEMFNKLKNFKLEALESKQSEEARELEKIIFNINNYIDNNKMLVLKVEPNKLPYEKYIINDLKAMQSEVNGLIEMIDIDDHICIVCNEEGKILDLELNRVVGNDIIAGNFFVVRFNDDGDTISLSKEEIKKYSDQYNQKSIEELENKLVYMGFEKGGKELC